MDCQEGTDDQPVIDQQQQGRHAGHETDAEGEYGDHAVVLEQIIGEDDEAVLEAVPGREQDAAQIFGAGARPPPTRQTVGNDGIEPFGFAVHQHEPGRDAQGHRRESDQDMPACPAHGVGEAIAEEMAQSRQQAGARSIDHQIGPQRQGLEIAQQIAVERDAAGDGQRGQRRAVEQRHFLQLVGRDAVDPPLFDARDQVFEFPPAFLAPSPKLGGAQHDLGPGLVGHADDRRRRSGRAGRRQACIHGRHSRPSCLIWR